jgi:hypothetical protein
MGYYNVDDNIPVDLSFRGSKNKNNEIRELKKNRLLVIKLVML